MVRYRLLAGSAIAAVFFTSTGAYADAETQALRAQIKALEARLDQMEKREKAHAPVKSVAIAPAPANLEQRVARVEEKQKGDDIKAQNAPSVEVGSKGFAITSADKQYSVRMRAYAQADLRKFYNNGGTANIDSFLIRSARPIIEAKMTDYINGRIMLDFGGGQTRLLDAYADLIPNPSSKLLALRVGKQKSPIGLERWQSEQEIFFAERGMPTNLVPFRDIGVVAMGEVIPKQLEYQIGYLNGAIDLADNNGDTDNHGDVAARVFTHPFRSTDISLFKGLGVGIAGTYGEHNGSVASPNLVDGYRTPGQARFFTFRAGAGDTTVADGTQWRVNPQAYYYNGPFGALAEYVSDSQEVSKNGTRATLDNTAWTAIVNYVLTGENASFDGIKPKNDFDWKSGDWGAFEVLARYGRLDVDDKAFPFYANIANSARSADEHVVGLNWHVNSSLKFNFDYAYTTFDGGAAAGADREDEQVFTARTQFRF